MLVLTQTSGDASRSWLWIGLRPTKNLIVMRIEVVGDESISRQARTYAEYRLFAALSQVLNTGRVRNASLVLLRSKSMRHCDLTCTVTVELNDGGLTRLRAFGEHPYAAINRAVERLRHKLQAEWNVPSHGETVAAE